MKTDEALYLGVDLAKESFDAAICDQAPDLEAWAALAHRHFDLAHNDPAAAKALRRWVREETGHDDVELVVVESTGCLSTRFARLVEPWPVKIADPYRIKKFVASLGQRHKSDRVDAAMIALYAARRRPEPTPRRDPAEESLRAITRLRASLAGELARWKCRLHDADDPVVRRHIKAMVRQTGGRMERLDQQARQAIETLPCLSKQMRDIQQIPGIKTVIGPVLTAELGDLASYSRNALAAAAGVYPAANESGARRKGARLAKGGSKRARCMLHMAARSLFCSKGPLRDHIEYLQGRGMSNACILGVMMRKLLLVARAVVRNGGVYDPDRIRFARA